MKKPIAFLAAGAMLLTASFALGADRAPATPPGLVVVDSKGTMVETEKRLVAAIESAGLKIAARIDHAANAKSVGASLPPTLLLIFGNPKAGTGLIEQMRTIGIDLPLKALVWEEGTTVRVAYNDPAYIASRHGLDPAMPVLAQMTKALERFTAAATE